MGSGGKSQSATVGHDYHGKVAMALCVGPVARLHAIYNGDEPIWEGPLQVSAADGLGRSVLQTDLGTIHFYWGLPTQAVDPVFGGLQVGAGPTLHPPYRGVCYFVGVDLLFGSSPTPPNLIFDIEGVAGSNDWPGVLAYQGDRNVAGVLWDLLTDRRWGLGVPADWLDYPSFLAAGQTAAAEGIEISPLLDRAEGARGIAGKLLQYVGGYLYESRGKLYLVLDRPADLEAAPVLGSDVLAGEPRVEAEGPEEVFQETRIAWQDRENQDERTTEVYTDLASLATGSRLRRQTIELDWIRKREVAKIVAASLGQRAAIAARAYRFAVLPSAAEELRPGVVAILDYPRAGIAGRPVRVLAVRRGGAGRRAVEIEAVDDLASDTANWSLPAADPVSVPSGLTPPPLETPLMRIGVLPSELVPAGEDGFVACIQRKTSHVLGAHIYFAGWAGGTWRRQRSVARFPATVEVLWWTPVREGNWLLRLRSAGAPDRAAIEALAESTGMLLVAGATDAGEEQTMLFWGRVQTDGIFEPGAGEGDVWDVEIEGTPLYAEVEALRMESAEESERAPTAVGFFGLLADLAVVTSPDLEFRGGGANGLEDTARVRYVRTPTFDRLREEPVETAAAASFDQPAGEYAPAWGASALSGPEAFDVHAGAWLAAMVAGEFPSEELNRNYSAVADIDAALGAMVAGLATAEELLRYGPIDAALGRFVETGFYGG